MPGQKTMPLARRLMLSQPRCALWSLFLIDALSSDGIIIASPFTKMHLHILSTIQMGSPF